MSKSSPTYSLLEMAAPPAVVNVPPLKLLSEFVVFEIPTPPEKSTLPVVLLVVAVELVF